MTVFALTVERPAGPVMIVVDAAGSIRYRGTKEKVAAVKTILRGSTATMHNLDDSKNTTPLRLVRKLSFHGALQQALTKSHGKTHGVKKMGRKRWCVTAIINILLTAEI